jgi:hypothetical protein
MCDNLEKRRDRFIQMARERHGDKYDYSLVELVEDRFTHVTIKCPVHGFFRQSQISHLSKRKNGDGYTGCRKCGNDARPNRTICIDCGCWNKYAGGAKVCKNCSAKRKESRRLRTAIKYLCRECGKPTGSRERIYCSSECRTAKSKIAVECSYCRKQVIKTPSKIKRAKKSFCGPECQRLSMIGNGDPNYASKKAKETWKKGRSARRRLDSLRYKWWRLCNRDWFTREEIDEWGRKCNSTAVGLRKRTRSVGKPNALKNVSTWDAALDVNVNRINSKRLTGKMDKWHAKVTSVSSNLKARRRYVEGKD